MKVLLIDDTVQRESIKKLLQHKEINAQVSIGRTMGEGVCLYKKGGFDALLLDCCVSGRDSIEMLIALRRDAQGVNTAIVMMGEENSDEMTTRCLKAGAQDFLPKSEITTERLRRTIMNAKTRFFLERELRESYEKAKKLAESDALTGLANRYVFDESLQAAITCAKRHKCQKIALLIIDVDNFKIINDTYGHSIGDQVLQSIVQRIRGCLRGGEIFARIGGDEFAIILTNLESSMQAGQVATRIKKIMLDPLNFSQCQFNLSVSIGIALCPDYKTVPETLVQHADTAMYRSKKLGGNKIFFYQKKMQSHFTDRIVLEKALRQSIENKQLVLHYQPCCKADSHETSGMEALVRWNHPERGLMYPDQFLSIAEKSLQIETIGRWVMEAAIKQLSIWNREHNSVLSIIINLSAGQLADKQLINTIKLLCNQYAVSPRLLEFDLVESVFFENTDGLLGNLKQLVDLGCYVAIDDFGSGYSSISHLRQFPIDIVKIDPSLMPATGSNASTSEWVGGLVSMLHSMGLTTVVEGVETREHAQFCRELGVDKVQGNYFSKALESTQIDQYLRAGYQQSVYCFRA